MDNRNYPGGPAAFMKVEFSSKFPVNAAVGYIGYLVSAMTDGLLVKLFALIAMLITDNSLAGLALLESICSFEHRESLYSHYSP